MLSGKATLVLMRVEFEVKAKKGHGTEKPSCLRRESPCFRDAHACLSHTHHTSTTHMHPKTRSTAICTCQTYVSRRSQPRARFLDAACYVKPAIHKDLAFSM